MQDDSSPERKAILILDERIAEVEKFLLDLKFVRDTMRRHDVCAICGSPFEEEEGSS